MNSLFMENLDLKITIEKLEAENKFLRKEIERLTSVYNPSEEDEALSVMTIFADIEKTLNDEEVALIDNQEYRSLSGVTKRDKDIIIALSINNGMTRDAIAALFFRGLKNPKYATNNVMLRLVREGHVRVDKKQRPYAYYSKHEFKKPSYEGYVYIIKEFHSNTYKIGKAKNIENRLRMFNVKLPFEWDLIHTIKCDDYSLTEKLIQKEFSAKRIKGTEWFNLDESDIVKIKSGDFTDEIKQHITA